MVSELPHDEFLTINSNLITDIKPIWANQLEAYEFPGEAEDEKEILPKPCE